MKKLLLLITLATALQAVKAMSVKRISSSPDFFKPIRYGVKQNTEKVFSKKDITITNCYKDGETFQGIIIKFKYSNSNDKERIDYLKQKLNLSNFLLVKAFPEEIEDDQWGLGFNRIFHLNAENLDNNCNYAFSIIDQLNSLDEIEFAEPNYTRKLFNLEINDPFLKKNSTIQSSVDPAWGLKKTKVLELWDKTQGEGIKVSVIDSGIDFDHPDLWDNIWLDPRVVEDKNLDGLINLDDVDLNANKIFDLGPAPKYTGQGSELIETPVPYKSMFGRFYDGGGRGRVPIDGYGHGTHVAGIMSAVGNNNKGGAGVAFKSKIIPTKVYDSNGEIINILYISNAVKAAISDGAKIINMSYGSSNPGLLETQALALASSLGLIPIAAAGNSNTNIDENPIYPASYSFVISVASTNSNDEISEFSNFGETVDIAAPGSQIVSTLSEHLKLAKDSEKFFSENSDAGYWILDGTSMAAPFISGVVALVCSKYPSFKRSDIQELFKKGSDNLKTEGKKIKNGRINAVKFFAEAQFLQAFYAIDIDTDKGISFEELALFVLEKRKIGSGEYISKFDINGDSKVDVEDLKLITKLAIKVIFNTKDERKSLSIIQKSVNILDSNRDGVINDSEITEYKKLSSKKSKNKKFDVNNDKKIDKTDYQIIDSVLRALTNS